jgi:HAD superfamily hydrolase (TIGR01509 family)
LSNTIGLDARYCSSRSGRAAVIDCLCSGRRLPHARPEGTPRQVALPIYPSTIDALVSPESSLIELVEAVRALPYRRPSDRTVEGMLRERCGTCSTKHRFLDMTLRMRLPDTAPRIVHRVYRLDRSRGRELFGAAIAEMIPEDGLVDVHRYLTIAVGGERIIVDATFPGEPWDGRSSLPLACGQGRDHPAGENPDAEKLALEARYCDRAIRERFLAALTDNSDDGHRSRVHGKPHDVRPLELVIFDCDGVLVDSESISNEILARLLTVEGLSTTTAEAGRQYQGLLLAEIVSQAEAKLSRSLPKDFLERFERERAAAFRNELRAIPGAAQAVRRVSAAGVAVCVASQGKLSKTRLTLGLTGLRDLFPANALFSAESVPRGKPEPDLFLHAARLMGAEPACCVVVEDTCSGVTAALSAGMRALAYAADGDEDALLLAGAESLSSLDELPKLLALG